MTTEVDLRATGQTSLHGSILSALAYSGIFNYPLKLTELLFFLTRDSDLVEIRMGLDNLKGKIETNGVYYFLSGRREIVGLRLAREAAQASAYRRACLYGRMIGRLPFIRMVGLTGSLALLNCNGNIDYDYFLVTKENRVWLGRAFALILNRIASLFGETLCPNIVLSESALEWQQKDLYAAREICQMKLISGEQTYLKFRRANRWTDVCLPNASISRRDLLTKSGSHKPGLFKILGEFILRGKFGDRLESFEMNRKVRMLTAREGNSPETKFGPSICWGNFQKHGAGTRLAYMRILEQLGIFI